MEHLNTGQEDGEVAHGLVDMARVAFHAVLALHMAQAAFHVALVAFDKDLGDMQVGRVGEEPHMDQEQVQDPSFPLAV